MANRVTISVIGSTAPCQDHGAGQTAVNTMIAFWQAELAQVWSDRPDLIYERYALNTVCGILAGRRFGIPLVLEVHGVTHPKQRP